MRVKQSKRDLEKRCVELERDFKSMKEKHSHDMEKAAEKHKRELEMAAEEHNRELEKTIERQNDVDEQLGNAMDKLGDETFRRDAARRAYRRESMQHTALKRKHEQLTEEHKAVRRQRDRAVQQSNADNWAWRKAERRLQKSEEVCEKMKSQLAATNKDLTAVRKHCRLLRKRTVNGASILRKKQKMSKAITSFRKEHAIKLRWEETAKTRRINMKKV